MVAPTQPVTGTTTATSTQPKEVAPFLIIGDGVLFRPRFFPDTIRVTKPRNLDRDKNFCKGEDVTDNGSKNRDIHLTGRMLGSEMNSFDNLVESSNALTMTSASWSGEIRVAEGEHEGPNGYHPPSGDMFWKYTLDLVSTGRDERDGGVGNGIIDDGETGGGGSGELAPF